MRHRGAKNERPLWSGLLPASERFFSGLKYYFSRALGVVTVYCAEALEAGADDILAGRS